MPGRRRRIGIFGRPRRLLAAACLLGLLAACASRPDEPLDGFAVTHIELDDVPFFPQDAYQCGPAALAMVLNWSGQKVSPEALVSQVYLPERKGSLQAEMIGSARRAGRVAYPLRASLRDLIAEVAAGNPVVVLQNLGLDWSPRWHYAVVVGFDLDRGEIVLRSGLQKRHIVSLRVFDNTWKRGQRWALVVLPPGRLPATAEEKSYLQAVAPLERLQLWKQAEQAYAAALAKWPNSLGAKIGLGNTYIALDDLDAAEAVLRQATIDHPTTGVTFNNFAEVLARQGRTGEALDAAEYAVRLGGPLKPTFIETRDRLRRQEAAEQQLGPPAIESSTSDDPVVRGVKVP